MREFRPVAPSLFLQVGNVPVFWLSDRDRRRLKLERHIDRHGCGNPRGGIGIFNCPDASRLLSELDDADKPIPLAEVLDA